MCGVLAKLGENHQIERKMRNLPKLIHFLDVMSYESDAKSICHAIKSRPKSTQNFSRVLTLPLAAPLLFGSVLRPGALTTHGSGFLHVATGLRPSLIRKLLMIRGQGLVAAHGYLCAWLSRRLPSLSSCVPPAAIVALHPPWR